jgi:hypothetical protein
LNWRCHPFGSWSILRLSTFSIAFGCVSARSSESSDSAQSVNLCTLTNAFEPNQKWRIIPCASN